MKKTIIFEGKVTLAGQLVDFRIYKVEGNGETYYSYEVNPEVKDISQADYHRGEIQRAHDLETLIFRFNEFRSEFTQIVGMQFNTNY